MSGTKTGLGALNEMMFQQLERLNNPDIAEEELETEIKRAGAMKDISSQIIEGQKLALRIIEHADEYGYNSSKEMPKMLEVIE